MTADVVQIPFTDGMTYGCGVDMIRGAATGAVLLHVTPQANPSKNQSPQLQSVDDYSTYTSFLNVTATAEGTGWGDWGEATVKTSGGFLRSLQINQHSAAFLLSNVVQTVSESLPASNYPAIKLIDGIDQRILSNPTEFLRTYGTHFVAGYVYGASFVGSIKVQARSEADFVAIQASLSGSVLTEDGTGKFSSSFTSTLQTLSANHTVEAWALVNGNKTAFTVDDAATMQDQMQDLGDSLGTGNGNPVTAICLPWEVLEIITNLPGFIPGSLTPDVDSGALEQLRDEYNRLAYALATAQSMLDNSDYQGSDAQQEVDRIKATIAAAQGAIEALTLDSLQDISSLSPTPAGKTAVSNYLVAESCLNQLAALASRQCVVDYYWRLDDAFKDQSPITSGSMTLSPATAPGQLNLVTTAAHGDGNATLGFYLWIENDQVQLQASFTGPKSEESLGPVITPSETGVQSEAHWSDRYAYDRIVVAFG